MCDHMFVVTGGPGSGKSTLIDALRSRGFGTMPEAGRAIIRDQVRIGGASLPWANRTMFAELMLGWELRSWHEASAFNGLVFMDRGIADVVGYLTLCGLPVPAHVEAAAEVYRYNRKVFIASYWEAIYGQDAERRQGRDEARETSKVMSETYTRLGYQLIELPTVTVRERADFIVDYLKAE